jgi:hypothetical protein
MKNGSRDAATLDMLLNALESERHVRKALLLNLIDELAALDGLAPAVDAACDLLDNLESGPVPQLWFAQRVAALHDLVHALRPRPSGVVSTDPTRTGSPYASDGASAA